MRFGSHTVTCHWWWLGLLYTPPIQFRDEIKELLGWKACGRGSTCIFMSFHDVLMPSAALWILPTVEDPAPCRPCPYSDVPAFLILRGAAIGSAIGAFPNYPLPRAVHRIHHRVLHAPISDQRMQLHGFSLRIIPWEKRIDRNRNFAMDRRKRPRQLASDSIRESPTG